MVVAGWEETNFVDPVVRVHGETAMCVVELTYIPANARAIYLDCPGEPKNENPISTVVVLHQHEHSLKMHLTEQRGYIPIKCAFR